MTQKQELAYQRKAKLRKKHRKVRAALVSDMTNLRTAVRKSRKGTVAMILNQPMTLQDVEFDVRSQFGKTGLTNIMQVQLGGVTYKLRTSNSYLVKQLKWFQENGHLPLRGWKFINWNLSGIGNPDYRIVRPDWTPEEGF